MNQDLLVSLAHAAAENEKAQRKFRIAVLIRLSRIDTLVAEIMGAQLAQSWSTKPGSSEKEEKFARTVEDRVSSISHDLMVRMVKFIYGTSDEAEVSLDKKRKWSDWEI